MFAARPILAMIPEKGAAAQLIKETSTGLISDCSDVETTKNNIVKLYTAWLNGTSIYNPNVNEIKKYERNNLTASLAKVFDHVLEKAVSKPID